MQESKEPIEFTETSRPEDELDVQEEVCHYIEHAAVIYVVFVLIK